MSIIGLGLNVCFGLDIRAIRGEALGNLAGVADDNWQHTGEISIYDAAQRDRRNKQLYIIVDLT